ncbi:ribonuclease III domain-containing protein [Sporobolomyces salmoneus]|uniref:ribonuclease III domain-containing protein n=1 Tax=Sporobolomyces salmoneus TaxID=183962 RepID=UPI0031756775
MLFAPRHFNLLLDSFKSRTYTSPVSTSARKLSKPPTPTRSSLCPHPIFEPPVAKKTPPIEPSNPSSDHGSTPQAIDDRFAKLAPLEQIKVALSRPCPATFPRLRSSILDSAIKITAGGKVGEGATPAEFPFCSVKQLAFYGDRIWSEVTVRVLLEMRAKDDPENKERANNLAKWNGFLVTNELAARLIDRVGLASFYRLEGKPKAYWADIWEAYLAALYLEKGREALVDFLTPIVRSEYEVLLEEEGTVKVEKKENVVPAKEKERLRILALPKTKTIFFPSLKAAESEFCSRLKEEQIPYLFDLSPSSHSATLQLPGTPLIAVKTTKKKLKNRKASLLARLVNKAVILGCFKIIKLPTPPVQSNPKALTADSLKAHPLIFSNVDKAKINLFKELQARKVKFALTGTHKNQCRTLEISGFPPIVVDAPTTVERRCAFVEEAMKLGVVKLKSNSTSSS